MNLRTLFFLARRDLLKDLRVLALVLLAVGSGALAIIPLNGLMEGFTAHLSATTVEVSTGHIIVSPGEDEAYIKRVDDVQSRIESLGDVAGVSARLIDRAVALKDEKNESLVLRGVDPDAENRTTTIAKLVTSGRFLRKGERDGVVLGATLAGKLGVGVGETVLVQFANGRRTRLTLQGVYSTGLRDLDSGGLVPLKQMQGVLGLRHKATEAAVRLSDEGRTDEYRGRISNLNQELTVETWRDRMAFIGSLRRNMGIIQTMMVVLSLIAAGIAISVLMYTNIQHKVRSIGILKAIGTKDRGILALYVLEGLILGVVGAVVGDVLGSAVCLYLSANPIQVTMGASEGAATATSVKAVFSFSQLVVPSVAAVLVTLAASCYPAWRAARTNIMEAIWHE